MYVPSPSRSSKSACPWVMRGERSLRRCRRRCGRQVGEKHGEFAVENVETMVVKQLFNHGTSRWTAYVFFLRRFCQKPQRCEWNSHRLAFKPWLKHDFSPFPTVQPAFFQGIGKIPGPRSAGSGLAAGALAPQLSALVGSDLAARGYAVADGAPRRGQKWRFHLPSGYLT